MIEGLAAYVSPVFIATTFLTVGFLFYAVKQTGPETLPARLLLFLVAFWMVFQASLALGGFHLETSAVPPRVFAFGALPGLLTAVAFLILYRDSLISRLPLRTLTLLHVIRIPVELTLLWLYRAGLVPEAMTFEGHNFDILSGVTAPIVWYFGFRDDKPNRPLLLVWNFAALVLLAIIVITAILAFPSPMQLIAFDQPNRGILYFPYVWLPTIVVPIVFFSHIAAIWKLLADRSS